MKMLFFYNFDLKITDNIFNTILYNYNIHNIFHNVNNNKNKSIFIIYLTMIVM